MIHSQELKVLNGKMLNVMLSPTGDSLTSEGTCWQMEKKGLVVAYRGCEND